MQKSHKNLTILMIVFVMTIASGIVVQPTAMYAYNDYVWSVERGGADHRAGSNMLSVDYGYLTHEDLYNQCCNNWYSVEVIERMINYGYMLDYVQQLKDGGWIPNDFTPTPVSSSTGSSGGNKTVTDTKPSYSQEEIDAAWAESKRVEPTCTSDGYIEYKNALTEETKTEALPMLEHDYKESAKVEATCETDGSITYTCILCNEESYTETIEAVGHQSGDWVVVKEPSLFSEGVKEQRCVVDNAVLETATIAQTSPLPLGAVIAIGAVFLAAIIGLVVFKKRK